jgi:hypothetical protein
MIEISYLNLPPPLLTPLPHFDSIGLAAERNFNDKVELKIEQTQISTK